jgi:hypothetical protein
MPDCGWHHDEPDGPPEQWPAVPFKGDLRAHLAALTERVMADRMERVETAIRTHLETAHGVADYVHEIVRLQRILQRLDYVPPPATGPDNEQLNKSCYAEHRGMLCDRRRGHLGAHVDIYGPLPGHVWPQEEPTTSKEQQA